QARILHKLAGACSNFGLQAGAAECLRREYAARQGNPCGEPGTLRDLITQSLQRLAAFRPGDPTSQGVDSRYRPELTDLA
ncbi:MAG TPA: Hpt domain-containing protein, partial [Rhodocyclaceae bacterium]|nr:Hpt domain-containing protein [Rhodocyclaceae bacterium]